MRGCIVTLVEFFSTVHFEMSLRRTWIRAGKFALIAFIWFFSTVFFKCLLKVIWWEQANLHCLHLFNFSPLWIIKCLLKDSLDSNPSSCSSGLTMSRSKSMINPLSFDWKIPNNWIKYEWTALKKKNINGLHLGIRYLNCPNQIRMLELIKKKL